MPKDQDGLRFLFDIQDKISAKLAKIEAKSKASAAKIDSAFTKASKAQQALASKVIHTEKLRGIAVENATAKATAARTKETAQGKILAQRLSAAQSREARQAANFRIAAVRRAQMASDKAERAIAAASKARARVAIKAEKDHERATKARAREQQRASEKSAALARKAIFVLSGFAAALAAASVKLVALGSDAEETENVTGLAFGKMKEAAEEWAKNFAASTGSSRFESIELVSDLGLIVKGMGFTEEASLKMSSRMVELAADMASAKNVPLDVALEKIRAGLIGESEPLRTMGVLLSEARVKEEAYASGLAETGAELTNTEKVQARMNIILEDSVAMHGDLINTQDSVANQWRAIKNDVFDAATALGQKLLPVASEVLGVLGEWVKKGADLLTWITESEERMKVFGAILAGVVVTGIGLVIGALWLLVPAIAAATGGISLIIPAIALGVGALVAAWILFGDTIMAFLRGAWDKLKKGFHAFKGWLADAFDPVKAKVGKVIKFFDTMQEKIVEFAKDIYEGIEKWMFDKLDKIFGKINKAVGKVTDFFEDMQDDIVDYAEDTYDGIEKWMLDKPKSLYRKIDRAVEKVIEFFEDMKDDIVDYAEDIHKGIKLWLITKIVAVYSTIKTKVDAVIGFFSNMKDKIIGAGKAAYEGIKLWLSDKLGAVTSTIQAKVGAVTGLFGSMKDKIIGAGKAAYEGIKLWLSDKLGAVTSTIQAKVGAVTGLFGSMKDKIIGAGKAAYEGIKLWLSDKIGAVSATIKGKIAVVIGFFSNMKDKIIGAGKATYEGIVLWLSTKIGAISATIKAKVGTVIGFFGDMKDKIVGSGKAAYEGIKLWLSDKLGAIFTGIKAKIDSVTGFFGDMKDKIVGNSIVPDMVDLVGSEFNRMGTSMVTETTAGADGVTGKFGEISGAADTLVTDIGELDTKVRESTAAENFTSQWNTAMGTLSANISESITGIFTGGGSPLSKLTDAFKEFGKGALSSVLTLFVTPFQNALTGLVSGLAGKLTGLLTGGGGGGGLLGGVLGGGGGTAGAAGAAGGGGAGILGGVLGAANPAMMWAGAAGLVMMGIGAIGQLFKANKQKAIEENTRFSAIDLHGIRHGLATGEFFMQDWHIIAAINHVNDTLVATLWSIRYQLVNFLPAKIKMLLAELKAIVMSSNNGLTELKAIVSSSSNGLTELKAIVLSGDKRLTELRAIHTNTSGLIGAIQSIPKGLTSKDLSLAMANARGGPEMFVPSQSGRIEPNGSSGGGVDAKALGKAVAKALEGTRIQVDGRKLGRLTVRHQPLAITELGGRR